MAARASTSGVGLLDLDLDALGEILRFRLARSDDGRDRLADEAHDLRRRASAAPTGT